MRTTKTRHQFYLPDDLSEAFDRLAAKPGASKTAILTDALRAWLERRAGNELDQRFGPRLDRQSQAIGRVESKLEVVAETLDVFILHQLTLTAHQPPFEEAARQLGRKRYETFMDMVARRLAQGRGERTANAIAPQSGDNR